MPLISLQHFSLLPNIRSKRIQTIDVFPLSLYGKCMHMSQLFPNARYPLLKLIEIFVVMQT